MRTALKIWAVAFALLTVFCIGQDIWMWASNAPYPGNPWAACFLADGMFLIFWLPKGVRALTTS